MTYQDLIQTYKQGANNLIQLHKLLSKQLIKMKVIESDGTINGDIPSFTQLIHSINRNNIRAIYNIETPNQPIEIIPFQSELDIENYFKFYTKNEQNNIHVNKSLTSYNLFLAERLQYYRDYLIYHLTNMGVDPYHINETHSLEDLILLLNEIEVKKGTYIKWLDEDLHTNINNILNIQIFDDKNNDRIFYGTIKLYERSNCIGEYDITDDITYTPPIQGLHTYTIEYVNNNLYDSSTITKTIDVKYASQREGFQYIPNLQLQNDE